MINLKLTDREITLNTHNINGVELYKAQDLLYGYGMSKSKTNDTIRNWKVSMENQEQNKHRENYGVLPNHENQVVSPIRENYGTGIVVVRGGNDKSKQGTYLTKENLLKLAGYVSVEFEDAVYKAFSLISEGEIQEACKVVSEVILDQKLIDKALQVEDDLKIAITNWRESKCMDESYKNYCIRRYIICKILTGTTNIKELRQENKVTNFVKIFIKLNHKSGLIAFIETCNLIIPMLEMNMDYSVIKDMINRLVKRWEKLNK